MCDPYDFERSEELQSRFRKARKEHECFACGEPIASGHVYHYEVQKYDGEVAGMKHCLRCWEMLRSIWGRGEAAQFDLRCGILWEEAMGDPPPEDVAALAFLTPEEAQAKLAPRGPA